MSAHVETREACASHDPELWFSNDPDDQDAAKTICLNCPLMETCATLALTNREEFGIWGATTAAERAKLRGTRLPVTCGTQAGWARHQRLIQPVCPDCRDAHLAHRAETSPEGRALNAADLFDQGLTATEVASRLGLKPASAERAMMHAGRRDLATLFRRAS